ncbi:MAG: thioredoxin-disulfide reductase [Syntrophomonadaceae bacterium]
MYDVIIIGGGPAGLTAAIYTGRAKRKTLVLEASMVGGTAATADAIDNYPGFPEGIDGQELMDNFRQQAERFKVEIRSEEVTGIENLGNYKKLHTSAGTAYLARAVIIAVGTRRRKLGVSGEEEFAGRGVSYCATCDGAFFHGLPVAVVGGGDSAVKEALYLANIASKVYLIHRRDELRANPTSFEQLRSNSRIELKLNRVIQSITGDEVMRKLLLKDTKTGREEYLEVEGLFVSIGLVPASEFVSHLVDTRDGYILADENLETSVKGIFVAGDIRVKEARQIATAVGDGAQAGMAVNEYLK